jgi:hypothetical protein
MDLSKVLGLLPIVGPIVAKAPAFIEWYNQAAAALKPADQETARQALADIQADNDEGHARLQRKLAEAAKR